MSRIKTKLEGEEIETLTTQCKTMDTMIEIIRRKETGILITIEVEVEEDIEATERGTEEATERGTEEATEEGLEEATEEGTEEDITIAKMEATLTEREGISIEVEAVSIEGGGISIEKEGNSIRMVEIEHTIMVRISSRTIKMVLIIRTGPTSTILLFRCTMELKSSSQKVTHVGLR